MDGSIEEIIYETMAHPVYRHLIPLQSTLSYPIPVRRVDRTYLRFFVYQQGMPDGNAIPIYRPYAHLSIHYPTGNFVEFLDLAFIANGANDSKKIGTMPSEAPDYDEFVAQEAAFYETLEDIIPLLGELESSLTETERATAGRYQELFSRLVNPSLQIYYQELNPKFFEWLDRVARQPGKHG